MDMATALRDELDEIEERLSRSELYVVSTDHVIAYRLRDVKVRPEIAGVG